MVVMVLTVLASVTVEEKTRGVSRGWESRTYREGGREVLSVKGEGRRGKRGCSVLFK
jgi:hypothetical protein